MSLRVPALLLALCVGSSAQDARVFIETIAGAATFDNRPARETPLVQPQAVWIHPNGDVYISDGNFVVRRVRNGLATIVAGGGSVVDNSLPIPAKTASLDYPTGLAGTASGDLYIIDANRNRVQRLNADGTIVTIVGKGTAGYSGDGGRGTFAELYGPSSLVLSPTGDLFIADSGNAVIRKYNIATGIITTYAGTPNQPGFSGDGGQALLARFGTIRALALDAGGNLYISDTPYVGGPHEARIRRITPAGIVSTYAGSGPIGFSGDGGPATGAKISASWGMAVDAQSNLYIADSDNAVIRRVTPAGTISTYAGQSQNVNSGLDGVPSTTAYLRVPGAIALDSAGNLFIPETGGELVRRVDARTNLITTVAGTSNPYDGTPGASAPLNRPISVATDRLGNLYIADVGHYRVRRIDALTGLISTVAGDGKSAFDVDASADSLGSKLAISVDPLNRLLIADREEQAVFSVDLNTRKLSLVVDLYDYDSEPTGVVGDALGNVYISDWYNDLVLRYSPDGRVTIVAGKYHDHVADTGDGGPADQADLNGPQGLLLDRQGRLLICDTDNHRVRRVSLSSNIIEAFAGDGIDNSDYDGFSARLASLQSPVALAIDSDGWIYIADSAAHRIRVVTTDGLIFTQSGGSVRGFAGDGGPGILSLLDTPLGVATAGIDVFVADSFNYRIRHLLYKVVNVVPVVDPPRLSFRATRGGDDPSEQLLAVSTSYLGLNIDYTVDDSAADWLLACTATEGTDCYHGSTPDLVEVFAYPTDLPEGSYSATLVIRAAGAPDVRIPVDFTIDPPSKVTAVTLSPGLLRFTVPQNSTSTQQVAVTAAGKAALPWSIRRQTNSPWLKFSATSGVTPVTVEATVDTTGLKPGTYSAFSYFDVSGGSTTLFITTITVSDAKAAMLIDRDSMLFEAVEGTTSVPSQPLRIYNSGGAPLSWLLSIPAADDQRRSVNWMRASAARDTVQVGGPPSSVDIAVDPSGLRTGTYTVPIVLTAAGASGAPQVIGVRLRILPAGTPARGVFSRTALLFAGSPGAKLDDQTIELTSTGGPLSFSTSTYTEKGGQWLSITPANGWLPSSSQKAALRLKVVNTEMTPGVYSGSVKFSFSDGSIRQVNVALILRVGAGAADPKSRSADCQPSQQVLVVPTLSDNFALTVGWPIPMQAQVFDDCGVPSTTSSVNVTFDNGDPVLVLRNLSGGQYAGTWTPASAASGAVGVTMQALRPGILKAEWRSKGRLSKEASTPPILAAGGVLNAASRLNTSLVAPGGRLVLQGANFPEVAADATVLIGGAPAKVVSSAAGEMQIVAPAQMDGVTQTYVIVNARGFTTSPQTVSVVTADPGLYPLTAGAITGGTIIALATGLGSVDSTGKVVAPVTATLGTYEAAVAAATLPTGADGVYQIKITVPSGASGPLPLTITQNGVSSNQSMVNLP